MTADVLTMVDLRRLCGAYVPRASRHPHSLGRLRSSETWWYAHELGHLLTSLPGEIGQPMFGLDVARGSPRGGRSTRAAAR